jgi:tRNA (cytidine32/uridine32-2'-O)-methyltransferase
MDEMELNIMRGMLTAMQNYIFHTDAKLQQLEEKTGNKPTED